MAVGDDVNEKSGNVCDGYNLRIHQQLPLDCLKLCLKYGLLRFCRCWLQKSGNVNLSHKDKLFSKIETMMKHPILVALDIVKNTFIL